MRLPSLLPVRLALLVAGTTLPLILFAGGLVYSEYAQDKQQAVDNVRQVTRSVRLVLDRELQGIVSGLTVLANSRALAVDDFENFRISANAFVQEFPGATAILLGDREGRAVFISGLAKGEPLPPRTERPDRGEVFRTGKPAFSQVFIGTVSKRPVVAVTVPVMRDGKIIYDLAFSPPLDIFQRIIEQQRPSGEWTMSIFDQSGHNIARLPNPDATIGQPASPQLLERLFHAPEADFPTVSREGTSLLTAVSRSELSGWVAVSGIAEKTLTAPLLQTLGLTAAIGIVMLVIGLGFAIRMATQIARAESLHTLLINEINHRVKNTLATVQSMASQTFRNASDNEAKQKFASRLVSLGRTHDVLSEEKWAGADLTEIVEGVLAPFQGDGNQRIDIDGPAIRLPARTVVMLAMTLHELATNAAKYGALSGSNGRVSVSWWRDGTTDAPHLGLRWQESDGPAVRKPERNGFGSTLIRHGLPEQLGSGATLSFEPAGVVCTIEMPLR